MAKLVFKDLDKFIKTCIDITEEQFDLCLDGKKIRVKEEIIYTGGDAHDRT